MTGQITEQGYIYNNRNTFTQCTTGAKCRRNTG